MLVEEGKLNEALDAYRACLAIRERLVSADRASMLWQRELSVVYNGIGDVLIAHGMSTKHSKLCVMISASRASGRFRSHQHAIAT